MYPEDDEKDVDLDDVDTKDDDRTYFRESVDVFEIPKTKNKRQ